MKTIITVGKPIALAKLRNSEYLNFVSDSQDVSSIKEHFGNPDKLSDFDSFFVDIHNGDYERVYGMVGIIPYTNKRVIKILN